MLEFFSMVLNIPSPYHTRISCHCTFDALHHGERTGGRSVW